MGTSKAIRALEEFVSLEKMASFSLIKKYIRNLLSYVFHLYLVFLQDKYLIMDKTENRDLFADLYKDDLLSDALKEATRQKVQNTPNNLDKEAWGSKEFVYPERTIRLATSFSGIGAIEHAFCRLGLKYEIVFAGDIEPKCKQSYFANYDITEERWHKDIHEFDATPYK